MFAVRELSEDQKMMIILSEDFQRFVDRTGRIMERALCESVDIYTDYTGVTDSDEQGYDKNNIIFPHLMSLCIKNILKHCQSITF